ncbi:MAG: metallophosphoesterase family protein [Gammaproteobacteria bacterium]|nr:metallophosphoesterase family protein [Gammaproteobacteria bacterium]
MTAKIIGIISDTHGLLRPEAKAALEGCDAIVHAGDIGKPQVLDELRAIAPVTAIRGNIDKWALSMPDTEVLVIDGRCLYVIHDVNELDLDPQAAGFDAVISGHSHKPGIRYGDGVLYLNPGSAGPRRFSLPVALARLTLTREALQPRIIELTVPGARRRGHG